LNNDLSKVVIAVLVAIALVVAGFFGVRHMHASQYNDAMVQAANRGDAAALTDMLAKGASPDSRDKMGMTALLNALMGQHLKAAKVLIEAGADVNATDSGGMVAPIVFAINMKDADITKLLIEKHVNLNTAYGPAEQTPLLMATQLGDMQLVRMLIEAGADVTVQDKNGKNVMDYASGNQEIASYLAAHGVPWSR
jgi:ankyrin repeat protein